MIFGQNSNLYNKPDPTLDRSALGAVRILWKIILIHWTLHVIKNQHFDAKTVWKAFVSRLKNRVQAFVLDRQKACEAIQRRRQTTQSAVSTAVGAKNSLARFGYFDAGDPENDEYSNIGTYSPLVDWEEWNSAYD